MATRPDTRFDISTMRGACWAACRSEPQMPQDSVLTRTWPAAGLGSGMSPTTMSPARKIAAFI